MSGLTGDLSITEGIQTQGARFESFFHSYSCVSPAGEIRTSFVDANSAGPSPFGFNPYTVLERRGSKGKVSASLAARDASLAARDAASAEGSRVGSPFNNFAGSRDPASRETGSETGNTGRSRLTTGTSSIVEGGEDSGLHRSPSAVSGRMPESPPRR